MAYILRKRELLNGDTTYMILHACRSASKGGTLVQKQVAKFKLSELAQKEEDPVKFLEEELQRYKDSEKKDNQVNLVLDFDFSNKEVITTKKGVSLIKEKNGSLNLGYLPYLHLYHMLEIDYFINNRRRYTKCEYNLNNLFQHLIYSRCLFPSSKLAFYGLKDCFGSKADYSLYDIYRGMDYFLSWRKDLLLHLNEMMERKYNRESFLLYYDVTNYYFETDENDEDFEDNNTLEEENEAPDFEKVNTKKAELKTESTSLRQKGPSKEHRKTPIVQMGLFMDEKGLPITYELFKGNTIDVETLEPIMEESVIDFKNSTKIVVADKGMMSFDNIAKIRLEKNGYVISQSVKKGGEDIQNWVLEEEGFEYIYDNDGELLYKIKERITPRTVKVTERDDYSFEKTSGKHVSSYNERQICIYSEHYAKRAAMARAESEKKAGKKEGTKSKDSKDSNYGCLKFLKKIGIKDGVEVEFDYFKSEVDKEELLKDAKFDGFYVICTNVVGLPPKAKPMKRDCVYTNDGFLLLNKVVTAQDIYSMYGGLWKIEETFKVSKTKGLQIRPIYHTLNTRIRAHFLICFTSLLIERLLEYSLNWKHSAMALKKSLSSLNGMPINNLNIYSFGYYDEVIDDIGKYLDIELDKNLVKRETIKQMIAKCKKID